MSTLTARRTVSAPAKETAPQEDPDLTVQGSARIHAALDTVSHPVRINPLLLGGGILAWVGFALVVLLVPNESSQALRDLQAIEAMSTPIAIAGLLVAVAWAGIWALSASGSRLGRWAHNHATHGAAWLLGSALWALFWEYSTAKTAALAPPYFQSPQAVLNAIWTDHGLLAESLGNSLLLLVVGFVVGLIAGLVTGVTIGWFQQANYWVHPILIFLGPVPSLAWVPLVFVLAPSAYSGAVFMIALSVWFPITVLTRAGVLSVPRSYFDVAQTLGAKGAFLVARISLPAALPSIFTGAFMALGASFVSLTVAENFGVNSGLGWYLNWKKGWGDYAGVYAGIVILVVVCGVLLTLLFRSRNWVLRWEKELTRW